MLLTGRDRKRNPVPIRSFFKRALSFVKRVLPVGMLLAISLLLSPVLRADPPVRLGASVIHVCGHPIYPPVAWVDHNQLYGVGPELVRRIFTELGYEVRMSQTGNWGRCLREAEAGNIDVVAGAFRIEERERYLAYSDEPIIEEPMVFFYNRKNPIEFNSWEDLRGKSVGVLLGDTFGTKADELIETYMSVERVSNGEQNFGKLVFGRIDVMPLGAYGGQLQAAKMGYSDDVAYTQKAFTVDSWFMGISRRSILTQHLPFVNQELKRRAESGEIDDLMRQFSKLYMHPVSTP